MSRLCIAWALRIAWARAPVAITRRLECRHVDEVGQVSAAEAGGALGNGLQSLVVQPTDTCQATCMHALGLHAATSATAGYREFAANVCCFPCSSMQQHSARLPAPPWPHLEVHVCGPRDLAKVHLQDLAPALHIGVGHLRWGGRGRAAGVSRGWRSARGVVQESTCCWQVSNSPC